MPLRTLARTRTAGYDRRSSSSRPKTVSGDNEPASARTSEQKARSDVGRQTMTGGADSGSASSRGSRMRLTEATLGCPLPWRLRREVAQLPTSTTQDGRSCTDRAALQRSGSTAQPTLLLHGALRRGLNLPPPRRHRSEPYLGEPAATRSAGGRPLSVVVARTTARLHEPTSSPCAGCAVQVTVRLGLRCQRSRRANEASPVLTSMRAPSGSPARPVSSQPA
jgi:hypothetical protein